MVRFDAESIFGDDYLYFHGPDLTDERSQAESAEIIETLELQPGSRVLDAPCGHGRIANLLAQHDLVVSGLDSSEIFLARAQADAAHLGAAPRYVLGDLRQLPFEQEFDAVLCWYTSFGYFSDRENQEVLAEFRRVLVPGGRVLIETIHHDAFVRSLPPVPPATSVWRVGDDLMVDESVFDSVTGRIETDRTFVRAGHIRSGHFSIRVPTASELHDSLLSAGFETVTVTDRNRAALTLQSRRLVVVAS